MSSSRQIIKSASNIGLSTYLSFLEEEEESDKKAAEDYLPEERKEEIEERTFPEKKEEDPYQETLLHLALEKAQRIIDTAEKEAERIKKDAEEEGYKKGFHEGYEKGKEEAEERIFSEHAADLESFRQDLNRSLRTVEDAKTERLYRYMDELKDVAIAVAEKVIHVSLRSSGEVIRRMIVKEAERIKKTTWLKIHIDRLDYEMLVETDSDVASELSQVSDNIKFVIVEKEEPGTLILETQEEIVDAGIDTQMETLRERLGHLDSQESV